MNDMKHGIFQITPTLDEGLFEHTSYRLSH